MDALAVVKQINTLAQKAENRESIVKDQGCLPGLVLFLDNNDAEVVIQVLMTLHLLAEHVPNRKIMYNEVGMIQTLQTLTSGEKFKGFAEIKGQSTQLHNKLKAAVNRPATRANTRAALQQRIHKSAPSSKKFFIGSSNKQARSIVLQISGLTDSTRATCEECLLSVRGVVSFTFDIPKRRCMVRVIHALSAETLGKAIEASKVLKAEQVVRNQSGEEVVLSFGRKPSIPGEEKESSEYFDYPDYLPEDDPVETAKSAVARPGDKDSGSSGWFTGVSNFISNSFYW